MELKDPEVTKDKIKKIKELLSYFDEVVLTVPGAGSFHLHSLGPARGDDRLYIHGALKVEEDN